MSETRLAAYMHVDGFESFDKLDFNRSEVRKGFAQVGREVQKEARRLTGKAGRSKRNEYPGRETGTLARSISYRVSRSGFLVRIAPQKTSRMQSYYPAYLHYGVKVGNRIKPLAPGAGRGRSNRRGKGERAKLLAARRAGAWRIHPRKNFMEDALQNRSGRVRAILTRAFISGLL